MHTLGKTVSITLFIAVMTGCATPRAPLSAAELERLITREYPGKTAQQVLDAAVRLWRLSDGDDYRITTTAAGLTAERSWTTHSQMIRFAGTDTWTFDATESSGTTTARMTITSFKRGTTVTMLGSTPSIQTGPLVGGTVKGTALHDIFWARMDFLLGTRPDWMTCAEADARVSARDTWGDNDALCNGFNMKDSAP